MAKRIKVREKILSKNDELAQKLAKKLKMNSVRAINVMASPGAGKTSVILETIKRLKKKYRIGVIDGDVVEVDVERIRAEGVPVELANTGGACHLDAVMVEKALRKLDLKELDLLIVENVGNLICPMNFAVGTDANVVIASVPEGDDKPEKYPGMFYGADVVLLNKCDYLEIEDFNVKRFWQAVSKLNTGTEVIRLSCRTGEGFDNWIDWLEENIASNE